MVREKCLTLTEKNYDPLTIPAPEIPRHIFYYRDSIFSFLRLKVSTASRCWMFDKSVLGNHVKRKIGDAYVLSLAEARLRACEWAKELGSGLLPPTVTQREEQIKTKIATVETVFREYFEAHVKIHNARPHEALAGFRLHWKMLANLRVSELTARHIQNWVNNLTANVGQATAARQFNAFRACINFGIAMGLCKVDRDIFGAVTTPRDAVRLKYLKPGREVAVFMEALESEHQYFRDIIKLLLLTGQRKSNVLKMEWHEIDFESRTWQISGKKTKTARDYVVCLSQEAFSVIDRRAKEVFSTERNTDTTSPRYVFPGFFTGTHIKNIDVAWRKFREKIGMPDLCIHSLRHSCASWLAISGASAHQIQRQLNHSNPATSAVYVHLNVDDMRDILEKSQAVASKGLFGEACELSPDTVVDDPKQHDELAARRSKRASTNKETRPITGEPKPTA